LVSNTHHIIAKDEHTTCDLVMDSSNTEWRNYTQAEQHNIEQVAACLDKIGHTGGSPNGAEGEEPTRKLHCPTEVTLDIVRSTIKQYDTVWFGGYSVMEQQFYTLHTGPINDKFDKCVVILASLNKSFEPFQYWNYTAIFRIWPDF
jgi:hypothetical protein